MRVLNYKFHEKEDDFLHTHGEPRCAWDNLRIPIHSQIEYELQDYIYNHAWEFPMSVKEWAPSPIRDPFE